MRTINRLVFSPTVIHFTMKPAYHSCQKPTSKGGTPSIARKTNITNSPPSSTSIFRLTKLPDTEGINKADLPSYHPAASPSFQPSSKAGLYPNPNNRLTTDPNSTTVNPKDSQITNNASPNSFSFNHQTMDEDNNYV